MAQDTGDVKSTAIEEIVVTAQKRAESAQHVPISMRAFTGENLHDMGVSNSEDVLKLMPGGGIQPNGGNKQNFYIRGVGTSDFHLNVVSAVGVYLDDVAINSPGAVSFAAFDVERVEVLRGPQNTLFGRNTTGGAVNYVSRKPSIEDGTHGYLRAGYGNYNRFDAEGAVGFALSDKTAARLSFINSQRDGVFNNIITGGKEGSIDRQALRGQLLFTPNDDWEILASFRYGDSSGIPNPYKMVGTLNPNDLTQPCGVPYNDIVFDPPSLCSDSQGNTHQVHDWEDTENGLTQRERIDTYGGTLHIDWNVGFATLTSISAYDSFKYKYREDTDGSPTTIFHFYQYGDYDQYSQELRLVSPDNQRFRWMAGFYWFLEKAEYTTAVRRIPNPFAPSGLGLFNSIPNTQVGQNDEDHSLYGQVDFDVQDDLTVTLGLRWTNETKKGVNNAGVRCVGAGGPPFCPGLIIPEDAELNRDFVNQLPSIFQLPEEILDYNEDEWGGRFSLDYKLNDDALLFASVSRGFKGGGFSIAPLQAFNGLAAHAVKPEILTAYEGGFKSAWLDGSLQVNGSIYYYDWKDLQSFQATLDAGSGNVVAQLVNFPKASVLGGELELEWRFGEGWYFGAGINVNHGQFDDVGDIIGASNGNALINNPDFSHTGLLRKEIQLANGVLALQTNWRYQGDTSFSFADAKNQTQNGYWNLAARASYSFGPNKAYEVSVWGDNLTGERYCLSKASFEGLTESLLCQPNLSEPTYGISAQVNFY